MKTIGYMEGTNSEFLTNVIVEGIDTMPLSNGWDNHGKFLAHITRTDNISVVVGYLHKFFTLSREPKIVEEILSSIRAYKIPTVIVVPRGKQEKAKKLLKGRSINYIFADPNEITGAVMGILRPKHKSQRKSVKKTVRKRTRKG
jgi:hypothetical protein